MGDKPTWLFVLIPAVSVLAAVFIIGMIVTAAKNRS